jgi:hypothetical protein
VKAISGLAAFEQHRNNAYAIWPKRDDPDNRIEPIAKPAFKPSFELQRGETVFTIGSCFARNIEEHLSRLGFNVPMVSYRVPDQERDGARQNNVLNKYNVFSINHAITFACDPASPPCSAEYLYQIGSDAYLDLQLYARIPVSLSRGLERQREIRQMIRTAIQARVLVVTLGLAEVWYDKKLGLWCNMTPPLDLVKKEPERFEFRVLDYASVYEGLKSLIALLDAYAIEGYRLLITVSPVPLNSTFTDQDVLVANTYSKSVQRAAVQQICDEYSHIDYFPSYESVTLSDRKLAYETRPRTHVTDQLVQLNVTRMIEAYCPSDSSALIE